MFRLMIFPLDSKEYKLKMEAVNYMKERGVDYWQTPIPHDLYEKYDTDFLSKN
jgi:hypothetical protein